MAQITEEQELLEALDKMYKLYNYVEDPFVTDYTDKISFHANLGTVGTKDFEFTIVLSKNTKTIMMFSMTVRYKRPQQLYVMFMPEPGQTVLPEGFNDVCTTLMFYLLKKGENTDGPRFVYFIDVPKGIMQYEKPKESISWPVELEYVEIDHNTVDLTSYDSSIVKPPTKISAFKEWAIRASFSELKKPFVCNGFIITHAVNQQSKDVTELKQTIFMGVEYDLDQRRFAFYHITETTPVFEFKKLSDDIVEDRELFTLLKNNKVGYQTIFQKYITDNVLDIKSEHEIAQGKLLGIFGGISRRELKTEFTDYINIRQVPSGGMEHMYDVSFVKNEKDDFGANKVMLTVAIGITKILPELSIHYIPETLISLERPSYFDELMGHFVILMRNIFRENDLKLEINGVLVPTSIVNYTIPVKEKSKTLIDALERLFGQSGVSKISSKYSNNFTVTKQETTNVAELYKVKFKLNDATMMFLYLGVDEGSETISLTVRNPDAPNSVTFYYENLTDAFARHLFREINKENLPFVVDEMRYVISSPSGLSSGAYKFK